MAAPHVAGVAAIIYSRAAAGSVPTPASVRTGQGRAGRAGQGGQGRTGLGGVGVGRPGVQSVCRV